jgi:hypothetical protein
LRSLASRASTSRSGSGLFRAALDDGGKGTLGIGASDEGGNEDGGLEAHTAF